jgi:outer membrane lipoprotein carrier protein
MKHKILIISTLFLLGSFTTKAQQGFTSAKKPEAVLKKIEENSRSTQSIQAEFIQYKHLDILEDDIESTGIFLFAKGGKVRWEYKSPYPYLILMNKERMIIKEGGKVQEYDTESNRVFKEINDLMIGLLSGDIAANPNFDIKIKESGTQALAILYPKQAEMKQMLQKVEMYFNKSDYAVSEIKMIENGTDYTSIVFKNQQFNVSVPDSRFMLH